MLTGRYRVALRSPVGTLRGNLVLTEREGALAGFLQFGNDRQDIRNGGAEGDAFRFEGKVRGPFGLIGYKAAGTAEGDSLRGTAHTQFGRFPFSGERE